MTNNIDGRILRFQPLQQAADAFRRAVEGHAREAPHAFMSNFPNGLSKATSMLLARYLKEPGFGEAELVANGDRGTEQAREGHSWRHLRGLLIDITRISSPPDPALDASHRREERPRTSGLVR